MHHPNLKGNCQFLLNSKWPLYSKVHPAAQLFHSNCPKWQLGLWSCEAVVLEFHCSNWTTLTFSNFDTILKLLYAKPFRATYIQKSIPIFIDVKCFSNDANLEFILSVLWPQEPKTWNGPKVNFRIRISRNVFYTSNISILTKIEICRCCLLFYLTLRSKHDKK